MLDHSHYYRHHQLRERERESWLSWVMLMRRKEGGDERKVQFSWKKGLLPSVLFSLSFYLIKHLTFNGSREEGGKKWEWIEWEMKRKMVTFTTFDKGMKNLGEWNVFKTCTPLSLQHILSSQRCMNFVCPWDLSSWEVLREGQCFLSKTEKDMSIFEEKDLNLDLETECELKTHVDFEDVSKQALKPVHPVPCSSMEVVREVSKTMIKISNGRCTSQR